MDVNGLPYVEPDSYHSIDSTDITNEIVPKHTRVRVVLMILFVDTVVLGIWWMNKYLLVSGTF